MIRSLVSHRSECQDPVRKQSPRERSVQGVEAGSPLKDVEEQASREHGCRLDASGTELPRSPETNRKQRERGHPSKNAPDDLPGVAGLGWGKRPHRQVRKRIRSPASRIPTSALHFPPPTIFELHPQHPISQNSPAQVPVFPPSPAGAEAAPPVWRRAHRSTASALPTRVFGHVTEKLPPPRAAWLQRMCPCRTCPSVMRPDGYRLHFCG